MNPLGNGNGLPPELVQNIQQVKGMMSMFKGNPQALIQQNPMLNQIMQMYQGQNPKDIFMNMCKQKGINPEQIINMLKS